VASTVHAVVVALLSSLSPGRVDKRSAMTKVVDSLQLCSCDRNRFFSCLQRNSNSPAASFSTEIGYQLFSVYGASVAYLGGGVRGLCFIFEFCTRAAKLA